MRTMKAIALTLVLWMLGGGLVGLAAAGGEASDSTVPAPKKGDHAVYDVSEFIIDSSKAQKTGFAADRVEFTWAEPRVVFDAEFTPTVVQPLRMHALFWQGQSNELTLEREAAYAVEDGRPVLDTGSGTYLIRTSSPGVFGTGVGARNYDQHYAWDWYEEPGVCGMRNALHDGAPMDEPLVVGGRCDYFGGSFETRYDPLGYDEGKDAYGFRDPESPHMEAWYRPGIPFPVEYTASLAEVMDREFVEGRFYRLVLEEYTPGEEEYVRGYEAGKSLGRVPVVPRDAVHEGAPTPLPFDVAMEAAVDAGMGDDLARPGAYLAVASSISAKDDYGNQHDHWTFIVTNGQNHETWGVRQGPPGMGYVFLGAAGNLIEAYRYDSSWVPDGKGRFPTIEHVPAALPLMSEIVARYQEMAPSDSLPVSTVYGIYCATLACDRAAPVVAAGGALVDQSGGRSPMDVVNMESTRMGRLTVEPDGSARTFYSYAAVPQPAIGLTKEPSESQVQNQAAVGDVWSMPPAEAVAGLSLVAFFAGLAYYFWPTLKALPFLRMFSRIREDQLLDHPVRRTIADLAAAEPGIHFQELARRIGGGRGKVIHHVDKMVAAGLLVEHVRPGYRCYFPKGAIDRRVMAAAGVLKAKGARDILDTLVAHPGASGRQVAESAGLSVSTVSYHVRRLHEAGLVDMGNGLHATDLAAKARQILA